MLPQMLFAFALVFAASPVQAQSDATATRSAPLMPGITLLLACRGEEHASARTCAPGEIAPAG